MDDAPFYRRILDNLSDAILLFDHKLTLVYINMPGEALFTVSARQLLGLQAAAVFHERSVESDMLRSLATGASLTRHNVPLSLSPQPVTVNIT